MTNCTELDPDVEITEIPIPPALKRAGTIVKNFYTQALDFATPMSRRDYWPTAGFYAATTLIAWWWWTKGLIYVATTRGDFFHNRHEAIARAIPIILGFSVWIIVQTYPFLAATSRRLVDAGYHWALSLLSVVPGVNLFILAACARPTAARAVTTTTTEETRELA